MQIQINTDHNIDAHEAMTTHVSTVVKNALEQFSDHITRVEVHLSDEHGPATDHKSGPNSKRCMMEVRLEGYHPVAVTAHADTMHQAIAIAADKLLRLVESTLGRLHDHKLRRAALTPDGEVLPEA